MSPAQTAMSSPPPTPEPVDPPSSNEQAEWVTVPWWREPIWMSTQVWTALTAAVAFLVCVVLVSAVPVPYVVWSPGRTDNTLGNDSAGRPVIDVAGVPTHPSSGELDLTTVSVSRVDSRVSLVGALFAYFLPGRDALDRDLYYPAGTTQQANQLEQSVAMSQAQQTAVVAAARQAGEPVVAGPVVTTVVVGGPADGMLQPGDLVVQIDGTVVSSAAQARTVLAAATSDGRVVWKVRRDGQVMEVTTGARDRESAEEQVGVSLLEGWATPLRVHFGIPEEIGGPSAGLIFSVAIYERITPGDLIAGRHIAGTGTIDAYGRVGPIGGIQSKIAGAEANGATMFFVPAANCADVAGVATSMQLVAVATLSDAVAALESPESARACAG